MDWSSLAAIVSIAALFVGIVVWAIRAESRSKANEITARESRELAQRVSDDLAAFKERAAREYVTSITMAAVRIEITEAITRLGDRLDRILDRST